MSERSFGPVVVRRRLGAELRRLREAAGMSLDQAARTLEISASKLSRVETGHSPPKIWDVRNLLTVYGVTDEAYRRRAERWVGEGRAQGWWAPYSDASPVDLDPYISLEAEAAEIRSFSAQVLYGLLQTEEYARALLRAVLDDLPESDIENLVAVRMRRREVLDREDRPTRLRAVVDESVLTRVIGSDTVMRDQCRHLAEMSTVVDLRVKRSSSVFDRSMLTPFTIFVPREDDTDPLVVNVEAGFYDAFREEPADVEPYLSAFRRLEETALDAERSVELLENMAGRGSTRTER